MFKYYIVTYETISNASHSVDILSKQKHMYAFKGFMQGTKSNIKTVQNIVFT